jgi:HPt (histidine-containing phosphotransfer) domain-containing protein
MRWITCTILSLHLLLPASAGWAQRPLPDKDDLLSIRLAIEDDLERLLDWTRQEQAKVSPERNPDAWVRLKYAEAAVLLSNGVLADPESFVKAAQDLARKRNLNEEFVLLQEIKANVTWDAGDEEKKYEELIRLARQFKLSHLEARYLALQGYILMAKGDYDKGMQPMLEAMGILQKFPEIHDLDRMNIKSALAQAFASGSDVERALSLDDEIVTWARSQNLRGMLASSLHNIAGYFEEQGGEKLKDAEAYYSEALALGRSLGGHYTIGPSLIGLSAIARHQGRLKEATQYALEAVQSFKEAVSYWKTEAWLMAAEAQLDSRAYDAVLQSLSAAEKSSPPELARIQVKILQLRAEALEKANKPVQALAALKSYVEATKGIKKNEDQASYSQRLAQLGMELEQEKNESLTKENELQSQKLKSAERIQSLTLGVLALALGVLLLLMVAVIKSREVQRRKFKMQRILDNIDEGILTIDKDLQIEGEYSQHLLRFLGINTIPPGSDALDIVLRGARVEDEQRGMIREILRNSIGESSLSWELNEANLPRELIFENKGLRTAALHWVPIFDAHGVLKRVLLSLRDQTERVQLKAEIQKHMQLLDRKELEVAELLNQDPARCHAILESCINWLESSRWQENPERKKQALRQLHTIKGNARSTGLWQISHAIHRLEDELQKDEAAVGALPGEFYLTDLIKEYQHLLNDIFHRQSVKVAGPLYLCDAVRPLIPDLRDRLSKAGYQLAKLSIDDAVLSWEPGLMLALADMIMHALNNSIDHGFLRNGKPLDRDVRLKVKAYCEGDKLCVDIMDNGAGLDLQKITRRARELDLAIPKDDPYAVLFEDGFSTARELSESSGRGVGLAAIAALSQEWKGSVRIQPAEAARGTCLQIRIPLQRAA